MKTKLLLAALAALSLGCTTPDATFLPYRESLNRSYSDIFKGSGNEGARLYFLGKADAYREMREELAR